MTTFYELSLILVAVTIVSGVMKLLKQPIIIGYILTGLLLGPQFLGIFKSSSTVSIFSEMGISILLFVVGMHLNPQELKKYGAKILLMGFGQILITFILGFIISTRLGYSTIASIYIGLGVTFSSTIVVLKLISDKKELERLYGKIAIAILLLQDIVAAVFLIFVGSISETVNPTVLLSTLIKGIALVLGLTIFTAYILPLLSSFFAKSQEYLFLFALAWGFGVSSLFHELGFSIEIGALSAGIALSISPYSQEISTRLRPMRDFFTVIFFIYLGSNISLGSLSSIIVPTLVFLGFVLLIKPLIVMALGGALGYASRTYYMAGASLSQISEFSMILALVGIKHSQLDANTLSMITFLGMVSILVSSYLINYAEKIYPLVAPFVKVFERKNPLEREISRAKRYEVILFGCNRVGYDFVRVFKDLGKSFLAIDFDPDVIKTLNENGINCVYGDAEDGEFLDEISVYKSKVVISTIPDYETNSYMLGKIREKSEDVIVILLSYDIEEAMALYEKGATYVVLPHFIGGEYAAALVESAGFDIKKLYNNRNKHIDYLKERKYLGHSHPQWFHHF